MDKILKGQTCLTIAEEEKALELAKKWPSNIVLDTHDKNKMSQKPFEDKGCKYYKDGTFEMIPERPEPE